MSKYKRYPAYKDSGVEWLGDIPAHWELHRLKQCLRLVTKKTAERCHPVALENIESWTGRYIASDSEFEADGIGFEPGDILFGKLRPYLAKVLWAKFSGEAVGDIYVMRPEPRTNGQYAEYQVLNKEFIKTVDSATFGTKMPRVSWGFLGDMAMLCPPPNEQKGIVETLDRETTRIDALIAKKTRFIELLREKRQALITRVVTKGLDPTVKMKDSGVEWLGEVPEHWIVSAFKRIVLIPITDGPHETPEFLDTGIPFVSAEAVSSGSIDFNKIRGYISHEDHAQYSKKYRPKIGDIYMVKSGATTGVTAIVETDIDFNIWSPLAVIRCGSNASPRFVLNFMRSKNFQEAIATNWSFGTQQNIGMGVIEDLAVLVPPLDEQKSIATLLSVRTARIDALAAQTKHSMSLLHERRSALITAAVTGLIDVRHFSNESINNLANAGAAS